jgi:GNAT superfamily N-acetyltransferase
MGGDGMLRYHRMTSFIVDILENPVPLSDDIELVQYDSYLHREIVPQIHKRIFLTKPWGEQWDTFEGFYAEGVFLLYHKVDKYYLGFIISYINDGMPYIALMGVMEEFQGQHLGTYLVQRVARNYAKMGYKKIWVNVKPHSEGFERRCLAMGFKATDEESDGDDCSDANVYPK